MIRSGSNEVGILPKCNLQTYSWVMNSLAISAAGPIYFSYGSLEAGEHYSTLVNFSVDFWWFMVKTILPLFMAWSFQLSQFMVGERRSNFHYNYGPLQGRE